ncbi:MAG: CapA family protein [Prevotella sp.]|nr:CapA family protein [Prevotella sp.]
MKLLAFSIFLLAGIIQEACNSTDVDGRPTTSVVYDSDESGRDTTRTVQQDTLVIALTGDIMMGTTYPDTVLPSEKGAQLFNDVKYILRKADVAVGNLEGTLCDSAELEKKTIQHAYAFRTPTDFAPRLKEAGYDFLSMANNHAFDFGMTGARSTEHQLDSLGISHVGVKWHSKYAIIEKGGIRYGLCAFGHNYYTLKIQDFDAVKTVLDTLREKSDIVIVSFHGGAEGEDKSHLPYEKEMFFTEDRGSLRDFAHFCIDNGADIVYGHGPHVVRCVEVYKDRFIAYSLGNFCTPYNISILGLSGYAPVIEAKINKKGEFLSGIIHPFIQYKGLGPRYDNNRKVIRQIQKLTNEDMPNSNVIIMDNGVIKRK